MKRYKLYVTFTRELLGSLPASASVHSDFVAAKALASVSPSLNGNGHAAMASRLAEEAARLSDDDELGEESKGRTVFLRDEEGRPLLADYVVRGYFKEVAGAVREWPGSATSSLKAYKSKIDKHLFVSPRFIRLDTHGKPESINERPLRANTAQGVRVALASSEQLPAGTTFVCELTVLAPHIITTAMLKEWLDYGQFQGFGQWRTGGNGMFTYKLVELDTQPR